MIDHYTEKHYEIKDLCLSFVDDELESNKREITINFNAIEKLRKEMEN